MLIDGFSDLSILLIFVIHDVLGTDIIGCIRIPAAYCGVIGFRPSHGVVSTIGVISSSQSLETVGR